MFERAVLRRNSGLKALDLGLLAETLLFYQDTRLIIDSDMACGIVSELGFDVLSRLVSEGHCKLSYRRNILGTVKETINGLPVHSFVDYLVTGRSGSTGKFWDEERDLTDHFKRSGYELSAARSAAKQVLKIAPKEKMQLSGRPISVVGMGIEDLKDKDYTFSAAKFSLANRLPGFVIPSHWRFVPHADPNNGGRYYIETNFDFGEINKRVPLRGPEDTPFSAESVLSDILDAREDMVFAAKHTAEIVTSPLNSKLMQAKFDLMNMRRESSASDIELFETVILQGRNLRDVINSGEKTFSEFLDLLDEARKFKSWLKDASPEAGPPDGISRGSHQNLLARQAPEQD